MSHTVYKILFLLLLPTYNFRYSSSSVFLLPLYVLGPHNISSATPLDFIRINPLYCCQKYSMLIIYNLPALNPLVTPIVFKIKSHFLSMANENNPEIDSPLFHCCPAIFSTLFSPILRFAVSFPKNKCVHPFQSSNK